MKTKEIIHRGSENVFADIGLAHPKRVKARAEIMYSIGQIIKNRGLTQKQVSQLLRLPQSKVSCLIHGKLSMFSLDHLFELLNVLDTDVRVVLKPNTNATIQIIAHPLEDIPTIWERLNLKSHTMSSSIRTRQLLGINAARYGTYNNTPCSRNRVFRIPYTPTRGIL